MLHTLFSLFIVLGPYPDPLWREQATIYCEKVIDNSVPFGMKGFVPKGTLEQCVERELWWIKTLGRLPEDFQTGGQQ